MWVNKTILGWFTDLKADADTHASVTKEALSSLREDLAAIRSERDALKIHAATDRANADWMRFRLNALEVERAGLIERAYHIKLPAVPEIQRAMPTPPLEETFTFKNFFEDVGEEEARKLGLPLYETSQTS